MITAGIDIGSLWTKAVVLRDGVVVGRRLAPTGAGGAEAAAAALDAALAPLGVPAGRLDGVVAVGAGKAEAGPGIAEGNDVLCAARGVRRLVPDARGLLDLGGESSRAVRLDAAGAVVDLAVNEKCAAGTGILLEAMGRLLRVPLDELGPLALASSSDLAITSTCVVFAESEVVSLIHRRTPPADILRALHRSIASRLAGLAARAGLGAGTVAIGGLARNAAIRAGLEELLRAPLVVPEDPQTVAALGAALAAADAGGAR